MQVTISTPEKMGELGASIAGHLQAGDLVALNGELGAGKTTLVRGLGEALGVRGPVTSPTFVLARTHPRESGASLVHVDAYRLSSAAELDDLDLDFEGAIVVVEWAAGMLEGIADSWLEIDIRRPTGGSGLRESGLADSGLSESVLAESGLAEQTEDPVEPREVTITGHGPRFADFRL